MDKLAFRSKRESGRRERARLRAEYDKYQRMLDDPRTRNRLLLEQDPDYAKVVESRLALLERKGSLDFPSPAPPPLPSLSGVSSCGGDAASFLERVSSSASSVVWAELQALPSGIDRVLSALKSAGGASELSDESGVVVFFGEIISLLARASLRSTLSPLLGEAGIHSELAEKSRFFESERQKVAAIHDEISELRESHSRCLREEFKHFFIDFDVALREKGACCVKHVLKEKGALGKLKAFALFAFASVSKRVPFSPLRRRMQSKAESIMLKLLDSETDAYDALLAKLEKKRESLETALAEVSALQARATPFARQAAEAAGKIKPDLEIVETQVGKQLAVLRRLKQQSDSGRATAKTVRDAFKAALPSSERASASAEKIHSALLGFCEAVGARAALPEAPVALSETAAAVEIEAARLAEARRQAAASLADVELQVADSQAEALERRRGLEVLRARERAQHCVLSISGSSWLADWQVLKSLCGQVAEAYRLEEGGLDSANNLVIAARQLSHFRSRISADASVETLSSCLAHLRASMRASGLRLKDARKSVYNAGKEIEELSSCTDELQAARLRADALHFLGQADESFSKAVHLHSKQAFFTRLFELLPTRASREGFKLTVWLLANNDALGDFGRRLLTNFLNYEPSPLTITRESGKQQVVNKFEFARSAMGQLAGVETRAFASAFARHDWDAVCEHVLKHVGGRLIRRGEPGFAHLAEQRKVWASFKNNPAHPLSWQQLSSRYKDALPPELHARFTNREEYSRELHYCYAVIHAIKTGLAVARLHDKEGELKLAVAFTVPLEGGFVFQTLFYFGREPCWATAFIMQEEQFCDALQVPFPRASQRNLSAAA